MTFKQFAVIAAMLFVFPVIAQDKPYYTVVLYHEANPPYSFYQNGKYAGIFVDLFSQISELTDVKFEFVTLSVARGMLHFNQGKVDIEPGINPIWRQNEAVPGLYSASYAFSREVIISKYGKKITEPSQLFGKVLGKVRGYRYGEFEQYFGQHKIMTIDNKSESLLIEQLYNDRLDYVLLGDVPALYYTYIDERKPTFTIVYEVSKLPVAMRIHPNNSALLAKINGALMQMKTRGIIDEIYQKYGVNP